MRLNTNGFKPAGKNTKKKERRGNWHHRPKTFIEKIVLAVGFGISMPSMIFFFLGIFGIIFSYL